MLTLTRAVRVFASAVPVDMRKGFDGLSALVEQQLGDQLLKGDVFLFVGRCHRGACSWWTTCAPLLGTYERPWCVKGIGAHVEYALCAVNVDPTAQQNYFHPTVYRYDYFVPEDNPFNL